MKRSTISVGFILCLAAFAKAQNKQSVESDVYGGSTFEPSKSLAERAAYYESKKAEASDSNIPSSIRPSSRLDERFEDNAKQQNSANTNSKSTTNFGSRFERTADYPTQAKKEAGLKPTKDKKPK